MMTSAGLSRPVRIVGVALLAGLVTSCASETVATVGAGQQQRAEQDEGHSTGGADGASAGQEHEGAWSGLPSSHVHGVAVDPGDGRVHLATHDGLFRYDETGPVRVGPVIDLMGFTVAGPDHFYASGHPGPGTDLPQPVGLIESTDGGQTWSQLSRQGQSDFHALTVSEAAVVGFDGTLRTTSDGRTWTALDPPVAPYALATSSDGAVLVATSESGLIRSTDAGATWRSVENAPLLQVVDWADGLSVVGVTPDGAVAVSEDAGATWVGRGAVDSPPQAVGAHLTPQGSLRVLVVTTEEVMASTDGGATFTALAAA